MWVGGDDERAELTGEAKILCDTASHTATIDLDLHPLSEPRSPTSPRSPTHAASPASPRSPTHAASPASPRSPRPDRSPRSPRPASGRSVHLQLEVRTDAAGAATVTLFASHWLVNHSSLPVQVKRNRFLPSFHTSSP